MSIGRRKLVRSAVVLGLLGLSGCRGCEAQSSRPADQLLKPLRVAVVSIVEIEPIAKLRDGFKLRLATTPLGRTRRIEYTEFNAQGDNTLITQVADAVTGGDFDVAYVLGTPLAQAIQARSPGLLIVQGAVTDPVSAGLAATWEGSKRRYIATSDLPNVALVVEFAQRLWPAGARVGVIYNQGEVNSAVVVRRLREAVRGKGPKLAERPVATAADIAAGVQTLAGSTDFIFVPPDNVVVAGGEALVRLAAEHDIPVVATSSDLLQVGALAAFETDYRALGSEAADLLAAVVFDGRDPASIPIRLSNSGGIAVQAIIARKYGLDLSPLQNARSFIVREHAAAP